MKNNKVTVLLPVYNAARFLKESIESILNQTYVEFELMIINDGSTDDSEKIILSIKDDRIRYLKNDTNKGLIYTLNRGLSLIKTDYLVRMDADDIAFPERIAKQIDFMEKNPEIAVCGAQLKYFGQSDVVTNFPLEHWLLDARLLFAPSISHPTAIIRMCVFENNKLEYDPKFLHIEDYHLWIRVVKYGKLANLPEVLLHYRWEGQNITYNNWSTIHDRYKSVYRILLPNLEIDPTEKNLLLHLELAAKTEKIRSISLLKLYTELIIEKNKKLCIYSEDGLMKILDEFWGKLFFKAADNSIKETFKYWIYRKSFNVAQIRYFLGVNLKKKGRSKL